jgi:hypothetical protein
MLAPYVLYDKRYTIAKKYFTTNLPSTAKYLEILLMNP